MQFHISTHALLHMGKNDSGYICQYMMTHFNYCILFYGLHEHYDDGQTHGISSYLHSVISVLHLNASQPYS